MSKLGEGRVLESVRVLDLADASGAFCTKLLAAMGADVIAVEPPGGSPLRRCGPFHGDALHPERSLCWFLYGLGKRSITLNIESLEGQRIFRELVKTADVVVETFRPGYLDGFGLGYRALSAIHPPIIMTSITHFGQTGPYRHHEATDMVAQAMGGLMYQCGDEDTPPVQVSLPVAYAQSAAQAAVGSLMAYYYRATTGQGQHVDVSVQECVLWAQKPFDVSWKAEGTIVKRGGDAPIMPGWPKFHVYFRCRDGWIAAMPTYWSHRVHLRQWLKQEGLAEDLYDNEAYDTYFRGEFAASPPVEIEESVRSRFAALASRYDKAYLYKEGQRRGMQVTPVNTAKDVMEDEQLKARDYWIRIHHPELGGELTYPGAPFIMSESPWRLDRRAPLLGEDNDAIYIDELGMTRQELVRLRQIHVI